MVRVLLRPAAERSKLAYLQPTDDVLSAPLGGQPREVDCGGQQPEVGVDASGPTDPGSSPAVSTAHEVAEFALDLGPGRAIPGGADPRRQPHRRVRVG